MILDAVCYPVIHFCRVILSRMIEPSYSQYFIDEFWSYLASTLTSTFVSGRLQTSAVSSPDATLLMICSMNHLFKMLDLPSGEDALTGLTLERCNQLAVFAIRPVD